ncbi:putative Outer membrane efflux protein [Cupriavidus taiwanensis]|uniref:efflux transporter outer membrane subunit n=1 Tax=Cupriavidus taiwanensis TaxID=164546 RepID=UPI000E1944B0|nr:efflux transporter outer membrane subunit [Cupriavidus taiwanensis]SOZ15091.1 putative Outer membrane efflux protein [Cupriavidus taiwanensis]SOZ27171.1 putative Outer membrane efflux protein [Cupriavidus taiwanensis]SOZ45664.1 putative Outer membrane efflux protein [Cupriavidus taiwanensis]
MQRLTSLFAAALVCGCAVGPDFQVPAPPDDTGYVPGPQPVATVAADGADAAGQAHAQTLAAGADVPAQWWMLFRSPELDATIRNALDASPTLAQARARLREAQENLAARTGATRWPAVDAKLNTTRQQVDFQSLGITAIPSPGPFTLYGATVQVSYVLDLFGGQRRELEGLQAVVDYQRYELEAARLALAANVATAAIREAGLRAQLADTAAMVAAQQRQLGITEARLREGGVARVEVQRRRAELAQTQALVPALQRQLDASRHQLAIYTGQTPAAAALPEFHLDALHLPDTLPLSLPATLARRRPDIRAAEALLHQASANIGVATANLYPQVTLSASGGTQATAARDLFSSLNVWSLAAGLVQPVFRGGELQARKRAAEAAYEQSLAAYRQAVLQGLQDVADALRALEADAAALRERADSARQARDTLAVVSEQYRLGGVSQLALLDAERQSRQAALELAQARADRLADSAALLQALGGGWWQESPDTNAAALSSR